MIYLKEDIYYKKHFSPNSRKMKKNVLSTLLFLFIVITINAQKTDLIVGRWVFKKALNKEVDKAGLAFMQAEVIDKWKFIFKSSGKFETYMMKEKATGEWKLSSDSKNIILSGIEVGLKEFKILKSTKDELILKLGLGEFLLKRIKNKKLPTKTVIIAQPHKK